MTEPAAVIALRELREEIDRSLEWVKREGFIVDYAVIQRGAGGLAAVVESSTAMHALLFVRQKLAALDALLARVEPQDEHLDPVECGIRERVSRQQREQYIYDSVETATADRADLLLRLDTTRTLLAAWQKRAYEAEAATARVEPPPSASVQQACGCVLFSQSGVVTRRNPCTQHAARLEPPPQEQKKGPMKQ